MTSHIVRCPNCGNGDSEDIHIEFDAHVVAKIDNVEFSPGAGWVMVGYNTVDTQRGYTEYVCDICTWGWSVPWDHLLGPVSDKRRTEAM